MSTLTLAPITVIFTGATMDEVHGQIAKYCVNNGITENVTPSSAPASVSVPTPVNIAFPESFIGERGELLKKDLTTPELTAWLKVKSTGDESKNWTIAGANRRIRLYLKELPPKLATAAREFARSNTYGYAPPHLIAEYVYCRWMSAMERGAAVAVPYVRCTDDFAIDDYIEPAIYRGELFTEKRLELAAKLIKEHGWKLPEGNSLANTEFQRIAIDCKKVNMPDGTNVEKTLWVIPEPMDLSKLRNMMKDTLFSHVLPIHSNTSAPAPAPAHPLTPKDRVIQDLKDAASHAEGEHMIGIAEEFKNIIKQINTAPSFDPFITLISNKKYDPVYYTLFEIINKHYYTSMEASATQKVKDRKAAILAALQEKLNSYPSEKTYQRDAYKKIIYDIKRLPSNMDMRIYASLKGVGYSIFDVISDASYKCMTKYTV